MKQNLLLLHGALGSKAQFTALIPYLSNHFNVYNFSFEGHGGISSSNTFSIDLFAKNALQFIKNNKIERCAIFGYSMGGYVALSMALKKKTTISKIVTLGTKFNWDAATTSKEISMLNPLKVQEKIPHYAAALSKEHMPLDWKVIMKKTAQMMVALSHGKALSIEQFKTIQETVIIGIGDEDKMVGYDESNKVATSLPNGHIKTLKGVPHPIQKIDPKALATFIIDSVTIE